MYLREKNSRFHHWVFHHGNASKQICEQLITARNGHAFSTLTIYEAVPPAIVYYSHFSSVQFSCILKQTDKPL